MLTEKIARKTLTIGAAKLAPGDVVTDELESLLPPGRVKVLLDQGWLSERPAKNASNQSGGSWETLVVEQQAQIDALEERVQKLEARRSPGRPRKAAQDG